jgi:polysaccharide export outer membrane protein
MLRSCLNPGVLLVVLTAACLGACSSASTPRSTLPATPASAAASPAGSAEQRTRSAAADEDELIPAVVGLPPSPNGGFTHYISPGDVLKVTVFQVDDLSAEERVNPSGSIVMPLIGPVPVAGLTTEEAERRIEGALGANYLQDPQVDIFVSQYANMNITVGGQVKKSGVFPMTGRTTLMQAVALAGGVSATADEEEVIVFRTRENKKLNAYVVDLKAIQRGELSDPQLVADDKILVPESGSKVFRRNIWDTVRGFVRFTAIPL